MRAIRLSFYHMLKFIRQDMMLFAAGLAPFLAGTAIRFGVPFAGKMLTRYTGLPAVLSPYYGLFDIFFASITPSMYCFISAMVILEEHDDHIDCYLFVTGLGKNGYFISRIIIPAMCAFLVTSALFPIFRLTPLSFATILLLSLVGTLQGIVTALLIVTLSSNKLEGMAVTKLSALAVLGAAAPYFMPSPICYFLSFLPSFWMGMAIRSEAPVYMLPAVFISGIWIMVLL